MAAPDTRTVADDVYSAMAALDDLARELPNLRAHLVRALDAPDPAAARQARRCARVCAGTMELAAGYADDAARHAEHGPFAQDRLVS